MKNVKAMLCGAAATLLVILLSAPTQVLAAESVPQVSELYMIDYGVRQAGEDTWETDEAIAVAVAVGEVAEMYIGITSIDWLGVIEHPTVTIQFKPLDTVEYTAVLVDNSGQQFPIDLTSTPRPFGLYEINLGEIACGDRWELHFEAVRNSIYKYGETAFSVEIGEAPESRICREGSFTIWQTTSEGLKRIRAVSSQFLKMMCWAFAALMILYVILSPISDLIRFIRKSIKKRCR